VFVLQSTTFIAIKHNEAIHIFNLKQDGAFPVGFKDYIETIRGKLNDFCVGECVKLWHEINDNSHNFAIILSPRVECNKFVQLTNAKSIIRELNAMLQQTCPEFHLNIDYITSFPANSTASLYVHLNLNACFQPPLVLCLFTENNCVSSITITIKMDKNEVSIDSKTNESYEGRKFNTLLRAVAIIISKSLNERVERLVSDALNPISAKLMIKYFNAVVTKYEGEDEGLIISKSTVAPENLDKTISDYFENGGMETSVELNPENIANATAVFHETIKHDKFNCNPLKGGSKKYIRKVIKKSKKIQHKIKKMQHKNKKYNTKSKKCKTKSKKIQHKNKKIQHKIRFNSHSVNSIDLQPVT
jgi:hypothetical protein